ncbi:reverse transcriptase [Phytophthora megakarya]|uniref:Reverse transcriptase n=1 Tax=Phytophthora megakarya TaxID=4795 RepID=A0A225UWJ7_9STRA|nr:reverse transcriptase [Phytophthora megakarya]
MQVKKNSQTEPNYGITELEYAAVVWAIKMFRPYLYGRRFTLVTDNSALKWLMTSPNLTGKLHRWALVLQEYEFEVQYRPGSQNVVADALSRAPVTASVQTAVERRQRVRQRRAALSAAARGQMRQAQTSDERVYSESVSDNRSAAEDNGGITNEDVTTTGTTTKSVNRDVPAHDEVAVAVRDAMDSMLDAVAVSTAPGDARGAKSEDVKDESSAIPRTNGGSTATKQKAIVPGQNRSRTRRRGTGAATMLQERPLTRALKRRAAEQLRQEADESRASTGDATAQPKSGSIGESRMRVGDDANLMAVSTEVPKTKKTVTWGDGVAMVKSQSKAKPTAIPGEVMERQRERKGKGTSGPSDVGVQMSLSLEDKRREERRQAGDARGADAAQW